MDSVLNEVETVVAPGRDRRAVYQLSLPQFEGPLDLLLHLIERRELAVTAISLAAVADQFLAQVAALPTSDTEALADFVAVGARLVLIKSRELLPRPPRPTGESDDEADDAEALARQLVAYRATRAAALALAACQQAGRRAYARPATVPAARTEPRPLAPVGLADLVRAVQRRLLTVPPERAPAPLNPVISLPDKLAQIEARASRAGGASLSGLLELARSRPEVIVTLIALLELVRRRRIVVVQAVIFGEIEIFAVDGAA